MLASLFFFFFFKQKTAYEISACLVGSEMCIRDRDWGTLDQEDWNTNQRALKFGDRLLSSYDIDAGGESRLWIITEANRSSTTLLLPSDY